MDMKKILQAVDGIATKPVEGSASMAKFLRVVKEAEINQQFPPVAPLPQLKVPPIPQLTALDGDLGNGSRVTTNADGTRSYSSGMGTFTYDAQGKAITYTSPKMSGYGQTIDLATNQIVHDYHAGPLQLNYKADAQGRPITSRAKYDLGVATLGHDNDHVSGIRSTEVAPRVGDGTDTAATLAAAHQIMPTSAIAGARGVDPAKFAAFQKQNPTAVKENSLSKFLSIVDNNNVSILKESANPHRVALPVQMAMQHYQQHTETPQPRERLIDKYFTEAETEITQRKEEKRAKINQYASVIAERVIMKESKQGVAEGESNTMDTVAKRLTDPKDGMTAKLRAAGDKRREDKLKGRNISRRDTTSKDEWGDLKELSTELLGNYKKAAGADAKKADAAGDFERGNKRFKGINRATNKQFDNDLKKHDQQSATEDLDEGLQRLLDLRDQIEEAIKQRLDPKCWKGKHKEGTKVKGGVRVNNCVPNKR